MRTYFNVHKSLTTLFDTEIINILFLLHLCTCLPLPANLSVYQAPHVLSLAQETHQQQPSLSCWNWNQTEPINPACYYIFKTRTTKLCSLQYIPGVGALLSPSSTSFQTSPFSLPADFRMEQKCQSIVQPSAREQHQAALASWAAFQSIIYNTWIITEILLLSAHSSPYNFLLLFFGGQHWNFKELNLAKLMQLPCAFRMNFP